MKKMIIAFLAVTLVFSLIGCDAMLNVMDKMSNNVAGTEKKVIDDALNAAKPVPSEKKDPEDVENEDGTKTTTTTFTQSSGEESKPLFSIGKIIINTVCILLLKIDLRFHIDTLRVLFAFRQQDGAAPRKLKNISLQITRCPCQRPA